MSQWFEQKFSHGGMKHQVRRKVKKNVPSCTSILIGINVAVFFGYLILAGIFGQDKLFPLVAIQPAAILGGENLWTIFTSIFMHANLLHLSINMFTLFFLGKFGVEKLIGKRRFLGIYLASGIFANLFFVVVSSLFGNSLIGARIFGDPLVFGVGASGALFGLIGVLAILIPKAKVYLILGPMIAFVFQFFLESITQNPSLLNTLSLLINIYFIFSLFVMFYPNSSFKKFAIPIMMPFWALPFVAIIPLILIGLFIELPIGNMAHLGGLIVGLGYGFYLKKKFPRKTAMISQYFSR